MVSCEIHKINEDLQRERDHCTFNVQELTHFIDGGPEKTQERKEREKLMFSAMDVYEGTPDEYLSHKEKYEVAVKKSVILFQIMRRMQEEGNSSIANYRDVVAGLLGATSARDTSPLCLHYIMFMPAILNQANQEQQAHWLPRAWNFSIIGSFAQTELGHGTFIRGLETTATYDASTRQFVLHSPTLTSYKWWPGGLGQTANYCIVVAQLYTKGKCHGIHSFMVQVRDEDTHEPLPGIKVGDIGAKLGLNAVNNGFLGFDNVRIPRANMLMKHAQVLEDGTYVSSRNSKLNYGAMVFVRVVIVFDMVNHLSKAVTIATRYSAVRRQSELTPGEREPQILDYLTQQHKIFIGIASCLAFKVTSSKLWNIFHDINDELAGGNLERLSELHALACCLKAVCTSDAAAIVERCRLACGGHGYMHSSNLPLIYGHVTAACTYEGENTVLLLQTARFLVKSCHLESANSNSTTAYLKAASTTLREVSNNWENSVEGIIKGFQIVGARKIALCVNNINKRVASGMRYEDAWNMTSVQLVAAAEMHCRVFIMSSFYEEITKASHNNMSSELKIVLKQLVELYAVYWALETLCDLLQYTGISSGDVDKLQLWYEDLLLSIRPNAVGLVDAFDIRDEILHSTLGAYDGRVYERLMEEALKSPLNAEPVNRSFHQHLKPFMQGKL